MNSHFVQCSMINAIMFSKHWLSSKKIDKQNYLNIIIQQEVSSGPALMIYKKEQKTYEIK